MVMSEYELQTTQGDIFIIDEDDLWWIKNYIWHSVKGKLTTYVRNQFDAYLHRLILDCNKFEDGHHKDNNGLNNTRINLEKLYIADHKSKTNHSIKKLNCSKCGTYLTVDAEGRRRCAPCRKVYWREWKRKHGK